VASAQNSTSPQGGTAIYKGAVKCASTGTLPADQAGLLAPPCVSAANEGQWITVMNASLKTSTNKTLFISPSLVTGLYTNTQVKGNNSGIPTSQTATAVASVAVRVLLDCSDCGAAGTISNTPTFARAAEPDADGSGIVFDARIQQLTATLGQAINDACLATSTIGTVDACPQEVIDLILSTTSAHTFNYIMTQVGSGVHKITLQSRLNAGRRCYDDSGLGTTSCTTFVNTALGTSVSAALFGLGSLTVMPVQLAPGFVFEQ
jgi:hypothetical protein